MKKYSFLYLILLVCNISFSQEIRGVVLDGNTNLPLEYVSVYFDQTTIGTTINQKGEFRLNNTNIKTPLIISYLGYKTKSITKYSTDEIQEFYLFESNNSLDEIIINTNDNWSRDLKLKEFKRHYLGDSKRGKSCRIQNEDDLKVFTLSDEDTNFTGEKIVSFKIIDDKGIKVNNWKKCAYFS